MHVYIVQMLINAAYDYLIPTSSTTVLVVRSRNPSHGYQQKIEYKY